MSKKAVLFLGSGATAGSGIKKNEHDLPTDGGFFISPLVRDVLGKGCYPALQKVREEDLLKRKGLYDTWGALFLFRSFVWSGVIPDRWNERDPDLKVNEAKCGGQQRHYDRQHRIWMRGNENVGYNLSELAIWDLRVLVKEVYQQPGMKTEDCGYENFWGRLDEYLNVSAVVNLNWDTTFDDWCENTNISIPIIRPHGSLKWTSYNRWHCGRREANWIYPAPWPSYECDTKLEDLGYRGNGDILDFKQPLIVTPEDYKETVVGNSSLPGLIDPILNKQWKALLKEPVSKAEHFIFCGLSLTSGDSHLIFLLKHLLSEHPRKVHFSCYGHDQEGPCDKCPAREAMALLEISSANFCIHPIIRGDTIESILSRTGCFH